ncbi:hypothetical protein BE221DRAFT_192170, partial [Ostreococcus tauri]
MTSDSLYPTERDASASTPEHARVGARRRLRFRFDTVASRARTVRAPPSQPPPRRIDHPIRASRTTAPSPTRPHRPRRPNRRHSHRIIASESLARPPSPAPTRPSPSSTVPSTSTRAHRARRPAHRARRPRRPNAASPTARRARAPPRARARPRAPSNHRPRHPIPRLNPCPSSLARALTRPCASSRARRAIVRRLHPARRR